MKQYGDKFYVKFDLIGSSKFNLPKTSVLIVMDKEAKVLEWAHTTTGEGIMWYSEKGEFKKNIKYKN